MQLEVIYIDDEPDLCEAFHDNFASATVTVTTFVDPKEAIAHIERRPPDLVFLDYRLPTETGDQIARRIDASIPKALLTGDLHVRPDYPFVKIFRKPFSVPELRAFIATYARVKPAR